MRVLIRYASLVLATLLVIAMGACSFEPALGDGAVACGVGGSCPPGYSCAIDGRCYLPGSGPGPIVVGDGGPDPGVLPSITITDISVQEGSSQGTTDALFTVRLVPPSDKTVTVEYKTIDDTAKAGTDYTAATGTLTFPPGAASQTITVKVSGDRLVEDAEKFSIELLNPGNAKLGEPKKATCTINDDDAPGIVVDDVTVQEGNTGITNAVFPVKLTKAYPDAVALTFTTADGTALEGVDYVKTTDTLTFAPGEMEKSIVVPVKTDTRHESDKIFNVVLSNVTGGAPLIDPQGTGTIKDDDPLPSLSINDVVLEEGNSGTTTMTFDVTLSAASGEQVKVNFATGGGTAATTDYAGTTGTLVFEADTTTKTIAVQINGDTIDEENETFNVTLSAPIGATLAKSTGVGTITDDDAAPIITVDDIATAEGQAGTTTFVFTVKLSTASAKAVGVTYATANDSAIAGTDYVTANGTLAFAAGETQKTVNVTVNGDTADEGVERFFLDLTNPTNATIGDTQAIATILNDDSILPNVTIDNVTVTEGNAGPTIATFTVSLSAASSSPITVTYVTANDTATGNVDYVAAASTVNWGAFDGTPKTISITINGDTTYEATETFFVNLTSATNANIIDAQGIGTITNDDGQPSVSIASAVQNPEGNSAPTPFAFAVTLSQSSAFPVTVNYASADGTASSLSDYSAASGVLTFAPGETTKDVVVSVAGDVIHEPSETFTVTIANPSGATLGGVTTGTGTITNDDAMPSLAINGQAKAEGNSGTTAFTFTVTLTGQSSQTVTVNWATQDASAVAPGDYAAGSGQLSFAPGETSKTITVNVVGDTANETNETFNVVLSGASGATIAAGTGRGTIQNDDSPLPAISINDVTVNESEGKVTFTLTINPSINQQVTVDYTTAAGTATASPNGDFNTKSGTVTFGNNDKSRTIEIQLTGDDLDELDETFFVRLSNPSPNASIFDDEGQATIVDNDPPVTVTVNDIVITEGTAGGNTNATFTITLGKASGQTVTVDYQTSDGTASSSSGSTKDYTASGGSVTFAPGEVTKTVTISVRADATVEPNETFFLNLSNAINATISDAQGKCTINNDD